MFQLMDKGPDGISQSKDVCNLATSCDKALHMHELSVVALQIDY
jgi:hypothetical protein